MIDQKYAGILHAPRPRPTVRPPMSLWDRAAQFAPFSALSGHAEGAAEVARTTQARVELSEDAIAEIERCLNIIESRLDEQPEVSITYFVPDSFKEGGEYITEVGRIKKIDTVWHELVLQCGKKIAIGFIVAMNFPRKLQ